MYLKRTLLSLGVAAVTTGALISQANATNLRFALGFPSGAPIEAGTEYAKFVQEQSDNKHKVKIFELSLLNHPEMSDGINKGLADLGYLLTAYFPSDYPYSNLGADMSMATALNDDIPDQEGYAYSGAMLEYIMLNCEECQEEYSKNNQVYTAVVSTPNYLTFCNDEVKTADDLKGKRVRISGAPWARWVKHFKANPVALPITEAYEALSQGVIDCTFFSATELTNYNLIEVVKNVITDLPGGLYAAGGAATMNKNTWNKFDDDEKKMFLEAGAVMTAEVTYRYQVQALDDLKKAEDKGIKVYEADSSFTEASKEFIKEDLKYIPDYYVKEYKLDQERANELSKKLTELLKKWNKLIADHEIKSADDLKQLYWDEVYSKVDVSDYGQ